MLNLKVPSRECVGAAAEDTDKRSAFSTRTVSLMNKLYGVFGLLAQYQHDSTKLSNFFN